MQCFRYMVCGKNSHCGMYTKRIVKRGELAVVTSEKNGRRKHRAKIVLCVFASAAVAAAEELEHLLT